MPQLASSSKTERLVALSLSRSVRSLLGLFALIAGMVASENVAVAGPNLAQVMYTTTGPFTVGFPFTGVTLPAAAQLNEIKIQVTGKQQQNAALNVDFKTISSGAVVNHNAWVTSNDAGWLITIPANSLSSNEAYDITVTATGNGGGNGTQTKRLTISP
jgi:hypothetical protein